MSLRLRLPPRFRTLRLAVAWAVALGLGGQAARAADVAKEYQIKAAFLYNLARYVEWPESRFAAADSPITFGVLGANPFGPELERISRGRRVGTHPIVVVRVSTPAEQSGVHVLFVSADGERRLAPQALAGVLTVGESERFAGRGGIITFISEAQKVRFMVNLDAANSAGLKISSQLLKLASVVRRRD